MASKRCNMSVNQAFVILFDNQEDCDVIFRIGSKTIGAHKLFLKHTSSYLYNLTKTWTTKDDPLVINDMSFDTFKAVLRCIYSDSITITDDNIFKFLYAAKSFQMEHLEAHCAKHINASLCKENVLTYVDDAAIFNAVALQGNCRDVFAKETKEILANPAFISLSQPGLRALLDVDEINVLEIELFLAVKKWMVQQCKNQGLPENGASMRRVIGDALYKIRFPTMTLQDFSNEVTTIDGLLSETEMLQTYRKISVFKNRNLECPFSGRFRWVNCISWDIMARCLYQLLSGCIYYNGNFQEVGVALQCPSPFLHGSHMQLVLQCATDFLNSRSKRRNPSAKLDHNEVVEAQSTYSAWTKARLSKDNNSHSLMSKFFVVREAVANLLYS